MALATAATTAPIMEPVIPRLRMTRQGGCELIIAIVTAFSVAYLEICHDPRKKRR
jgi:hypothetical protein